jgi:hypothetical protein
MMIRLHMMISPRGHYYLSSHFRISRQAIPQTIPRGVLEDGSAFIYNNADYDILPATYEKEIQIVADHLGLAMRHNLAKVLQT